MKPGPITKEELELLDSCQTKEDWSAATTLIQEAHGDEYPTDWWAKVKESGLMDQIMGRWGANSSLSIEVMPSFREYKVQFPFVQN